MTFNRSQIIATALATLLAFAALGSFAGGPRNIAAAQDQPAAPAASLPRTITVVGEGTVALQPDIATAQIGVDVSGPTAREASAEAARIMEAILAALEAQDVASKDIQTSNYSIFAERMGDAMTGRPSGHVTYRVNSGVAITVRDLATVGALLDAVIDAGANNIYGVSFSVSNPDRVMAEARRKAAEDARARAEELAALHGVVLGEVVSVSEVIGGSVPMPVLERVSASAAMGGGALDIQPGELAMAARLQVVYAIAGPATVAAAPDPTAAGVVDPASVTVFAPLTPPAAAPAPQQVVVEQVEVVGAAPAGVGKVTIRGDDSMLRPFLERWFSSMYRGMGLETTLTLGGLPDDLPFELVAPLGTQALYSLEQSQGMGTRIVLHTPLLAPDALDYLAARLEDQGYAQAEASPTPGDVFGQPEQGMTLCSPDGELGVMVTALPAETGSDIDIFILAADNTRCSSAGQDTIASRLLPRLTLPAGQRVQFSATGSGGSERSAYANSLLTIDLSPAELAAHYSQQLQAAGWERTSESQTDALAWSVWQFNDERGRPGVGTLLVAERPAQENALLVQIQIERQ
jgi:uncharacterized protein